MPGSRLTHDDRHKIELWLADGLGYAEIGRRLGRPTSTISREVARNGIPGSYLCDPAHESAGHRAHRRRPARPVVADLQQAAEARRFTEEFAALLVTTGMPRMAARVFACLLTADDAGLTSAELVRRLRVSPASVSKSIGYLEAMRLVLRRPDATGRRDRYLVDDDVWQRAWQTDAEAHGDVASAARRGMEIFGEETTAGRRLMRMGQFFGRLSDQMGGSSVARPVIQDALTVLAALVHAGRPLTLDLFATGLGWSEDRVLSALEAIVRRPALADPLVVRVTGPRTYAITTRDDRLTQAQRNALTPRGPALRTHTTVRARQRATPA